MNTLWFIVVVLLILYFQSVLYNRFVSRGLKVDRSFSTAHAYPGDGITLNISVTNRSLLPLTWMHIEELVPPELKLRNDKVTKHFYNTEYTHNIVMSMLPLQRVNRRYNVEFTKRGYYELKKVDVNVADMLGDNSYAYTMQASAGIVIYPKIADMSDSLLPVNSLQGDVSVVRWIIDDPTMLIGQRDYIRGDSMKSINWKRTARERHLMVNKHDYTSDKRIMLLLDLDELGDIWSAKNGREIEKAIEICAFIAERLISQGIPTGFATNALYGGSRENSILEPGAGNSQMREILDCLGRIQYYKKDEFSAVLEHAAGGSSWGTDIIIVVPILRDDFITHISIAQNRKITVIAIEARDMKVIPDNTSVFVYREAGDANAAI